MALKRINKKAVEDIVTFAWQVSQSFVIGLTGAEIFITSLGFQTVGFCLATKLFGCSSSNCCYLDDWLWLSLEGKITYSTGMDPESNCPVPSDNFRGRGMISKWFFPLFT